ncbi:histone-like nucleoid-structuring protein Lsr2 [Corynebacterium epidermidicanis]|uniref:Lsr2 n=1 Tax=Corynebacterium epidermidicanis TaxID=1050174 RepID=A0A0G3GSU5_9CORY|nr:Lsr2 family protein [Corynebacterium epidermidicanis]AKK04189.1 Lsr2 [Corynebacterium epidermidicanis]
MSRREVIQFFDDIDSTPLTQEEVNIVKFSLDGTNYILDLSAGNAKKFRELLEPYIAVARREGTATPRPRRTGSATPDSKKIREWARKNGYDVADRGKLPTSMIDAYRAAQK